MTLVSLRPFREMEAMQRQLDRLFSDTSLAKRSNVSAYAFQPPIELTETDEAYYLKLEVPGMDSKDIDIQASAEAIAISGERRSESSPEYDSNTRSEFRYGKFHRVLSLPGRIDHQSAGADYRNGILTLTLPKTEAEKNRVVKVGLKSHQ